MSTKPGVHIAADAYSACGSHELGGERHCCQLAQEPTGGVADDCSNDVILPPEEGRGIFFARSFLLDDALSWNSKRELNAGGPKCRATRRK